ncbi:hypothetical protein [Methylobacterium trifolii]|uniref:Uncharacterized protein n=1 Tax=Methylobacterium trifolii TaxID=1003092 RepID=A0ABQ4TW84_9HYPH|nr:hypothetical protein [Methylobacterium trifolii]GJE59306.1 hypothetical protein MPOCJGCO_1394 [Methylobacterium trifolii]
MVEIKVVAGTCGKGRGGYEAGLFSTPDGLERSVEGLLTVEAHGDVAGARNWGGQVLDGLKGSLALASNVDLSGTALLAASALAPLSADEPRRQTLLEITFADGALLIALADTNLSALIENDREVLRRGFARAARRMAEPVAPAGSADETGLLTNATEAVQAAAGAAAASASSALGFMRRRIGFERG